MEVLPPGLRGLGKTVPRLYHLVRVVGLFFIGLTAIFLQQAGDQEARRLTTLIHVFLALGKTEVEIAKKKSLSFRFSDSFKAESRVLTWTYCSLKNSTAR